MQITLASHQGAGGSVYYGFLAVNRSELTCQVGGYFGLSLYDQVGHLLDGSAIRSSEPGSNGVVAVPLTPGASATFTVQVGEVPTGNATTCPMIGSFHLIPPNATTDIQVSVAAGSSEVDCGTSVLIGPTVPS